MEPTGSMSPRISTLIPSICIFLYSRPQWTLEKPSLRASKNFCCKVLQIAVCLLHPLEDTNGNLALPSLSDGRVLYNCCIIYKYSPYYRNCIKTIIGFWLLIQSRTDIVFFFFLTQSEISFMLSISSVCVVQSESFKMKERRWGYFVYFSTCRVEPIRLCWLIAVYCFARHIFKYFLFVFLFVLTTLNHRVRL